MLPKKSERTPKSRVRAALRQLWLRSRERALALKLEHYTCEECNAKQSRAKGKRVDIEVHHIDGVEWEYLINEVFRVLLVHPDRLQILCKSCHKEITDNDRNRT
jgi:hypothetical protein